MAMKWIPKITSVLLIAGGLQHAVEGLFKYDILGALSDAVGWSLLKPVAQIAAGVAIVIVGFASWE